jgi:hypothetical protein
VKKNMPPTPLPPSPARISTRLFEVSSTPQMLPRR